MTDQEARAYIESLFYQFVIQDKTEMDRINRYCRDFFGLKSRAVHAEANNAQLARHRRTNDLDAKSQALVESLRELVARQDSQIEKLKKELKIAYRNNEERNKELDALHYCWCTGGCPSGVHRYDNDPEKITEEVVVMAERNTARLRTWWTNRKARLQRGEAG